MAISGGIDWVNVQSVLQQWVVRGSDLTDDQCYWGMQNRAPRHAQPAIEMKLSMIDEVGLPWLDVTPQNFAFGSLAVTAVSTLASTLTIPGHGLNTGDGAGQIHSTIGLPAPLQASTDYWVIKIDDNTIQLAASFLDAVAGDPAGSAPVPIVLTTAGSGAITLNSTSDTLRAGHEIKYLSRGVLKVCLTLTCYTNTGVGINAAWAILRKVSSRRTLPSQEQRLLDANIGLTSMQHVQTIHGIQDAVRFEPRAFVEVYLNLASEEAEDGTIIDYVTGTNGLTGSPFKLP